MARSVPFGRKRSGLFGSDFRLRTVSAILRCSTLQSTVSCAARDLVSLRVDDIAAGGHVKERATIIQHKTGRPVQFEIMEQTRVSLQEWLNARQTNRGPHVFPSRVHNQLISRRASTRASCMAGSRARGWKAAHTAHTRCGAPRRRRSNAKQEISERFSYFPDTAPARVL